MKKKKKFSWIRVLSVTAVLFLVLVMGAVFWIQPKMVFNPAPKLIATPAVYELDFEEVRVEERGLSVAGWLVRTSEEVRRGSVLCCMSSAGNRSYELDTAMFFTKAGFDVLLFDYPGFADSTGRLSEKHCYEAARMMFDYLRAEDGFGPLLVYGRARGAAVAAHLAGERSPDALVLEAAYASLPEQAAEQMGRMRHLILWDFQTLEFLKRVHVPVFFAHSRADREVPIALGRRVFEAFDGEKEFFETGGLHGDTLTVCAPAYEEALNGFLEGLGSRGSVGVGDAGVGE